MDSCGTILNFGVKERVRIWRIDVHHEMYRW